MFRMLFLFKSVRDPSSVNTHDTEMKTHKSGEWDLEMNHSHYLMLDDGRLRFYDTSDFRTRLCYEMAKLENETNLPSKSMKFI